MNTSALDANTAITAANREALPFPAAWIAERPREVERILAQTAIADQARQVMHAEGKQKLDLLTLSPRAAEVVRALAPEELYDTINEIGIEDCLPILSAAAEEQIQFCCDIEWWRRDRFLPEKAAEWLTLLGRCGGEKLLDWMINADFPQKVMTLQALIKVFKQDEMTDSYRGVEGLTHFTLDSVYDIFVKTDAIAGTLKHGFKLLRVEDPDMYFALLEAVIWCPATPTMEDAHHARMARLAARGLPGFEEAHEIYSRLDTEALTLAPPAAESFTEDSSPALAPHYPLLRAGSSLLLHRCFAALPSEERRESIRWQLVYLANKIMIADQLDPANRAERAIAPRKAAGLVNLGLEAGCAENPRKGVKLLEQSWIQSLFQAGYGRLLALRLDAMRLLKENGKFLDRLLEEEERERLQALVTRPIPLLKGQWTGLGHDDLLRDFQSIEEVRRTELFLARLAFHLRFAKMCLGLTPAAIENIQAESHVPEQPEDFSLPVFLATALARHCLFREVSCAPLPDAAAKTFLQKIFPPRVFADGPSRCDGQLVTAFAREVAAQPLAWTDQDKMFFQELIARCVENLESQYGRIDLKKPIEWQYTRALCIRYPDRVRQSNAGAR